jgi:hypothetical protein
MNAIELFFLNLGLSWTLAKLIPYIIVVIIGFSLAFLANKKLLKLKSWMRTGVSVILFVFPFAGYFAYSPIFQGDFSNDAKETVLTSDLDELRGKQLIVLALPGCPFCAQSMGKAAKLIERNPGLQVTYIITRADQEALSWYGKMATPGINVVPAKNDKALSALAKGKFPTFVVAKGNTLRTWSNDGFGVLAIDEVENLY